MSHRLSPFASEKRKRREFCRRQKDRRSCRHTPSVQKSKCARQVSWLTARSRVVWPSRERLPVTTLFIQPKPAGKKSQFACGLQLRGQLRIRRPLKIASPHSLFIALRSEER